MKKFFLIILFAALLSFAQTTRRASVDTLGNKIVVDKRGKIFAWYKTQILGSCLPRGAQISKRIYHRHAQTTKQRINYVFSNLFVCQAAFMDRRKFKSGYANLACLM